MLIVALIVGACAGGLFVASCEAHAQAAERIYRARRRDHSKVPPISWGSQ